MTVKFSPSSREIPSLRKVHAHVAASGFGRIPSTSCYEALWPNLSVLYFRNSLSIHHNLRLSLSMKKRTGRAGVIEKHDAAALTPSSLKDHDPIRITCKHVRTMWHRLKLVHRRTPRLEQPAVESNAASLPHS